MSRKNSAGSSITDLIGVRPVSFMNGGDVPLFPFPQLGASESFKAGEMVCMSGAAGSRMGLTKPGTDASGQGIVGFAADDAGTAISAVLGVYVATPDTIFIGNVGHSTSASAQTAATDCFQLFGLTSLSGRTYVDKSKGGANVSTAMVRVLGFHEQDDVPTFYGRVLFQVLAPVSQLVNSQVLNNISSPALAN